MKKELTISAKFDTSDFDKSVDRMQNRLKDLYAPADQVRSQTQMAQKMNQMGINVQGPGQEAYQRNVQRSRRELDSSLKDEYQNQEKLSKLIAKREDKLKSLKDQQKELVKGSKEELDIVEKIGRVKENISKQNEFYRQRESVLNQTLNARKSVAPSDMPSLLEAFKGGGLKYGMSQVPGAFKMNPLGMGGSLLGGIGSALVAGSEMYRDIKGMPIRTENAMGNAVAGTAGRDVNNIYGRRTAFEQNFQPERQKAAQMAIEKMNAEKLSDKLKLGGNAAMVAGGGLAAATGVGAIPGLAAAGFGAYNMMTDERQRSLAFGALGNKSSQQRYSSILGEQMSKDYEGTLEAQKRQNPFKTAAVGEYEQNYQRNLGAQRGMGLKNEEFYGDNGFMRKNINAGFTPEMGMEMAGSIQGAGGSTRMARESVFGNQLSRNADLTNAGQVLGTISGGVGGAEASKQATIKILAEGMKLGLDDSKFAEENRRFTQAAAEIISRSGAGSESDFQRNASNFSSFMGENTNKGIDAAKSAYEQYQQITTSTTGPRGVMRAAGFMKDKYLSQLSTVEKQALMQVPEEQLNENNPLVAGLAEKSGTSASDFIGRIRGVNQGSVSRFKEADNIRDRLKAKGIDVGRTGDPDYLKSLNKQDRQDVTELMSYQTTELGYQGQREMISRAAGTVGKPEQFGPASAEESMKAKIAGGAGGTGRMEDNTIAAMAGDASTVLKNFNEMRGGMNEAAISASKFTDKVRELNAELQKALENKDAAATQSVLEKIMGNAGGNTQAQAGKTQK